MVEIVPAVVAEDVIAAVAVVGASQSPASVYQEADVAVDTTEFAV